MNGVVDVFEAADSGSGIDVASYLADDASNWPLPLCGGSGWGGWWTWCGLVSCRNPPVLCLDLCTGFLKFNLYFF